MSLVSIIYNNPTDFHRYLPAYPVTDARRGVIIAAILGFDISQAMYLFSGTSTYDAYLSIILSCIATSSPLPPWAPAYTFGYETAVSRMLKGIREVDAPIASITIRQDDMPCCLSDNPGLDKVASTAATDRETVTPDRETAMIDREISQPLPKRRKTLPHGRGINYRRIISRDTNIPDDGSAPDEGIAGGPRADQRLSSILAHGTRAVRKMTTISLPSMSRVTRNGGMRDRAMVMTVAGMLTDILVVTTTDGDEE